MNEQELIALFRSERRRKEITQAKLAKKVGVATSFICEIERGNKRMNLEMLFKLAKALKVNVRLETEKE